MSRSSLQPASFACLPGPHQPPAPTRPVRPRGLAFGIVIGLLAFGLLALSTPVSAIVGGDLVRSSDLARRWTVKVESSKGELCTGVAIQPRLILTAAHCVLGGGRFSVSVFDDQMRRRNIPASIVIAHETFLPGRTPSTQPGIDLAMLKLVQPLPPGITPVSIGGALGIGERLTLAGYGLGQEGRSASARTLRQTSLLSAGSYTSSNSVIVAVDSQRLGQAPGSGACKGDSGGPIMRGGPDSADLVGIVSWSSGPANQRVRRVCGGFTAITPVADHSFWINRTANALLAMPDGDAGVLPRRTREGRGTAAPAPPAAPWWRPDSNN